MAIVLCACPPGARILELKDMVENIDRTCRAYLGTQDIEVDAPRAPKGGGKSGDSIQLRQDGALGFGMLGCGRRKQQRQNPRK